MKKYIAILILSFMIVPAFSDAQVGDFDPNGGASTCVSLVNNLRYKDKDINKSGEVSILQDFLQSNGYLNSEPTGYLGLLSLKAVKKFQKDNKITPTGYVGLITRTKIKDISCVSAEVLPPIVNNTPTENTVPEVTTPPVVVDPTPAPVSTLEIISPNGGSSYKPGRQITITWNSSNMTAEDNVYLSLIKESNGLVYLLSESTKNDGTETFTIPTNIREGKYKAYVKKVGTNIEDYSNDTFRIEN